MSFTSLKTSNDLKAFNEHLTKHSYVGGALPTFEDTECFIKVKPSSLGKDYAAASRWYKHLCSFNEEEKRAFPKIAGKANTTASTSAKKDSKKPAAEKKPVADEEDDSDFDLFGEETEEEKAANKAAAAKKAQEAKDAKAAKPKKVVIGKSTLVIEVMPYDSETEFDALFADVAGVVMEGVTWTPTYKKVPLAFGLNKLQIGCTIIDDLVETDRIVEQILVLKCDEEKAKNRLAARDAGEEDDDETEYYIQSADIVSFQKL